MRKRWLLIGGIGLVCIGALLFVLHLCACVPLEQEPTLSPLSQELHVPSPAFSGTPRPTFFPTPTPSPTPLFVPGRNSDLIINEDLDASISPTSYPLDKNAVILIYHTHGEEAYRQEDGYHYEETEPRSFKTLDKDKSIIALGRLLQQLLTEKGYTVLHDETDCEPPDIYSAYSRSLSVMEAYPEAVLYIDLHRNAANVAEKWDDVAEIDGKRVARMFFVVGTGIGTYEGEYDIAPDWQKNYQAARSLENALNAFEPTLCTPIRLKVGRHNQHLGQYALLLELGHNANTFTDAENALPYIVSAIEQVFPLSD